MVPALIEAAKRRGEVHQKVSGNRELLRWRKKKPFGQNSTRCRKTTATWAPIMAGFHFPIRLGVIDTQEDRVIPLDKVDGGT